MAEGSTNRADELRAVTRREMVTADWLTAVVGAPVSGFDATEVGTGQVGTNVRFTLRFDGVRGPVDSIVCKFPDPDKLAMGPSPDHAAPTRPVAREQLQTEVGFYREIAPTVRIRTPRCFYAEAFDNGGYVIALEDLRPAEQGDQIAGCDVSQAELCVAEAAALHGPRWADATLADVPWLGPGTGSATIVRMFDWAWQQFLSRYEETLTPAALQTGLQVQRLGAARYGAGSIAPRGLVHGDFRLDNMLFGTPDGGSPVAVVDWHTLGLGNPVSDVSYFLGTGLDIDDRRRHERALVEQYHEALQSHGATGYTSEECWQDYRRFAHNGFVMAVVASILVARTVRGDKMFMAMANRSAQQAIDLETESLVRG